MVNRQLKMEINTLRRCMSGEPNGNGGRVGDLPCYRRALAEIEVEFMALTAVQDRLAIETGSRASQAVAPRLADDLRLRVSALMIEVVGPALAADRHGLGHNERGGGDNTGLVDRYLLRLREQFEAEQSSTRTIADSLLRAAPASAIAR